MASERVLERLEQTLGTLVTQQQEICGRIMRLEERVAGLASDVRDSSKNGELSRERVLRFLDRFRAGEALGEASTGAWIAVSKTECLRGGLRTVQMREGMHARLLEQRLKELGGTPRYEIDEATCERAMRQAGDPVKSDAQKVLEFVQRYPDPDAGVRPILEMADRMASDPETQFLVRTIAQDERSTLEFFKQACALLNPA